MGTGELYAVVEWIPAAMSVEFAHWIFSLVRLRIVRFRRESVVCTGRIFVFRIFLGLQHLCVTMDSRFFTRVERIIIEARENKDFVCTEEVFDYCMLTQ